MKKPIKHRYIVQSVVCVALLICGCGKEPPPEEPPPAEEQPIDITPDVLPSSLEIKGQEDPYVISGIGTSGTNIMAIINNEVVRAGTELAPGVTVKEVKPTYAIVIADGKRHLIRPQDIQQELDRKK